jgi:hypothetical protein
MPRSFANVLIKGFFSTAFDWDSTRTAPGLNLDCTWSPPGPLGDCKERVISHTHTSIHLIDTSRARQAIIVHYDIVTSSHHLGSHGSVIIKTNVSYLIKGALTDPYISQMLVRDNSDTRWKQFTSESETGQMPVTQQFQLI